MNFITKDFRGIRVVFENCEVAYIEKEMLNQIVLDDIYLTDSGYWFIDNLYICLKKEINMQYEGFSVFGENESIQIKKLFDRIVECPDICGLDILNNDGEEEWKDNLNIEMTELNKNNNQKQWTDENGDLHIIISADKKFIDKYSK